MQHLLELGGAGEFLQAAPEFRPVLLFDVGANLYQLEFALFPRADFLAVRLAVLFFVHLYANPNITLWSNRRPARWRVRRPPLQNTISPMPRRATPNIHHRTHLVLRQQILP